MIHDELKKLRKERNMILKELSSKVEYGTGNLSSYENGKIKPRDVTLIRILTKGFGMSADDAKKRIILWRKRELEESYDIKLSQVDESYNASSPYRTLDEYLESEGLDKESIKKIKKDIQAYKKNLGKN